MLAIRQLDANGRGFRITIPGFKVMTEDIAGRDGIRAISPELISQLRPEGLNVSLGSHIEFFTTNNHHAITGYGGALNDFFRAWLDSHDCLFRRAAFRQFINGEAK